MHSVEIRARIHNRTREQIYATLCDFERYPELSPAVRQVTIDLTEEGQMTSSWETNFREGILRWQEQDFFDPAAGTIVFQQTQGDIDHFSGKWEVSALNGGGLISFNAKFDMGIPSLSNILDPIAEQALRENIITIIQGLFGSDVEIIEQ